MFGLKMSSRTVYNPLRRLLSRRSFLTPSNSNIFPIRNRHFFSLLGFAGLGTGLYLLENSFQTPAYCKDGRSAEKIGPPIKLIRSVTDLKDAHNYRWKYIILGCGTAAFSAVRAISENEPTADILIISPHKDIPESKDIKIRSADFKVSYKEWRRHVTASVPTHYGPHISPLTNLVVLTGNAHYHIEKNKKEILLGDGSIVKFKKLCIATTGKPHPFRFLTKSLKNKKKMFGSEDILDRVNELSDMAAFENLQKELDIIDPRTQKHFHETVAIVGGGFLGTEIALGCLSPDRTVYQLYLEGFPMYRYLPRYLSMYVQTLLSKVGVIPIPKSSVTGIELERNRSVDLGQGLQYNRVRIKAKGEDPLLVNYVSLASTRIDTDIQNAIDSGLEIDPETNGIVSNANLEVSDGIFVAGNCVTWADASGTKRRVNRYDHAKKSGSVAGHNMSNPRNMLPYKYEPGFQSRLREIGVDINALGVCDGSLKTVGVWCNSIDLAPEENTTAFKKGIVYYLKDSQIVGCLLWNTSRQVNNVRKLLQSKEARSFENIMDLKRKINIGQPELLNIMVEKKAL